MSDLAIRAGARQESPGVADALLVRRPLPPGQRGDRGGVSGRAQPWTRRLDQRVEDFWGRHRRTRWLTAPPSPRGALLAAVIVPLLIGVVLVVELAAGGLLGKDYDLLSGIVGSIVGGIVGVGSRSRRRRRRSPVARSDQTSEEGLPRLAAEVRDGS